MESAKVFLKRVAPVWRTTVKRLAITIAKPMVDHASLSIALFAGGLYLVGVIRTVGILHAEDIPLARGLPIVPLQDYLLRGLAVAVTPQIVAGFGLILLGVTVLLAAEELRAEQVNTHSAGESASPTQGRADVGPPIIAGLCVLGTSIVLMPVAEWLPIVPAAAIALFAGYRLAAELSPRKRSDSQAVRYVVAFLASLGLAWGLRAYWNPPPLERVKMTDLSGATRKAKVLLNPDHSSSTRE